MEKRVSRYQQFFLALLVFTFSVASADDTQFQEELLMQLMTAVPGTVIELPAGNFQLDTQLSLAVDEVTIRGQGMNKTILSFKNQVGGAEGLAINANKIKLVDFAIQDTKGDGIKITRAKGVEIRRVKVEWTEGPRTENGGYGIYPVQCEDVLIEDSVTIGASDAGLYVGQSNNIILRRNHAEYNVAGIEIENSTKADVYDNTVVNNSGGILIFSLPNLSQMGQNTRIYNNQIISNNTPNFSLPHNTVADLPTGTGIMVMANKNVEIFDNLIKDNHTAAALVVSYLLTGRPFQDPLYDPYSEGIYLYGNQYINNGGNPQGGSSPMTEQMIAILRAEISIPFPAIIFDGFIDPEKLENGILPDKLKLCFSENPQINFINLDGMGGFAQMSRDPAPHHCSHPKLKAVPWPFSIESVK